jgi:hypothetical protein
LAHWLTNQCLQADNTNGRIDLLIPGSKLLIVTEWKFFRITFLNIQGRNNKQPNVLTKAAMLYDFKLPEILQIKFHDCDQHHQGSIKQYVVGGIANQLRNYIKSNEVRQLVENQGLQMRAHLVIIIGSRHILLWDMDKDGTLADEPHLVGMTST